MRVRKGVVAAVCAAAALLGTASAVFASTGDTDDHFSLAAGTTVTGSLKTGTDMVFAGTINGVPITVTCTSFSGSGKVPAKGLHVTIAAAKISGCHDTLGGTDTIATNQTNGKWGLTEVDAPNDESQTEPNTGDKGVLTIPKAGATFVSSVLPTCVLTAAPTAAVRVTGTYNDINTDTVKAAKIPVSASGCSASTATVTATVVLSPNVYDVS
jgi:hypothetical protein